MEPVRLLRERGIEPHIFYSNSNIAPDEEYAHRLDTIKEWAVNEGVEITEDEYDPTLWAHAVAGTHGAREERCRACYRMRFERSAAYAKENGFDALGSTLSVSPYQYTQIIKEELERACENTGLKCFFEDYSPYYSEATRRSRDAGMYRQIYCGCAISEAEAEAERKERKAARDAKRAERAAARAIEEEKLAARKAERAKYDEAQARKRAVLKELRREAKAHAEHEEGAQS